MPSSVPGVKTTVTQGFKANPVNRKVLSSSSIVSGIPKIKPTRPKTTTVKEFKFATDDRLKNRKTRTSLVGTENKAKDKVPAAKKPPRAKSAKPSTQGN